MSAIESGGQEGWLVLISFGPVGRYVRNNGFFS